jgi:hypothetical protein
MCQVRFELADKPSSSKGWGRFSVKSGDAFVVRSRTGNEWVSASHDSEELAVGDAITLSCQTMNKVGKFKKEQIATESFTLIVEPGAECEIESRPLAQGMRIKVTGARLA